MDSDLSPSVRSIDAAINVASMSKATSPALCVVCYSLTSIVFTLPASRIAVGSILPFVTRTLSLSTRSAVSKGTDGCFLNF